MSEKPSCIQVLSFKGNDDKGLLDGVAHTLSTPDNLHREKSILLRFLMAALSRSLSLKKCFSAIIPFCVYLWHTVCLFGQCPANKSLFVSVPVEMSDEDGLVCFWFG